jgi:RimJ/RimL family protein N-acetyltransferase
MIEKGLILENKEILLRPLEESDLKDFLKLTVEPDMWRLYTHDLSSLAGLQSWASPAFNGERVQFTVIDKKTGLIIGSTAFGNISERDKRLEIGWTWLGKEFQGVGINGKVKGLLLTYCFEVLDLERVEFKTDVLNTQARRSMSNIHAIEEGVLRSHTVMTNGRRRDTIYFSILKNEWPYVKRENSW